MTRYAVRHETRYDYDTPVDLGFHLLHLTPVMLPRQRLVRQDLAITPSPVGVHSFVDHFGNTVHYAAIEATHERLTVVLDAAVEVADAGAPHGEGPPWETIREALRDDGFPMTPEIAEFVYPSPLAARADSVTDYVGTSFTPGRPIIAALRDVMGRIRREFAYMPNSTSISTQVSEVIAMRRGVCQDFAHLMIAGLRGLGLPARYVSGYIRTVSAGSDAATRGADTSHAWVAAWCGAEAGWIEFDPTNDMIVTNQHVVVAYGRDFSDVTPVRGVILGGSTHTLSVAVSVLPMNGETTGPAGNPTS